MLKRLSKVVAVMLVLALCAGFIGIQEPKQAEAATAKWSKMTFIVNVVKAMEKQIDKNGKTITYTFNKDGSVEYLGNKIKASTVNSLKSKYSTTESNAKYLAIAADMGLFKTSGSPYSTAKKIKGKVIYEVAMTILVAADEYLHGESFSDAELNAIKGRISNLSKAGASYRTAMVKAFGLGIYVGTNNGDYSVTRKLKYTSKPSAATSKKLVARLTDYSKRYKLTDDWQVIRTTKLPKMAKYYPYILESYPNAYYDWEFSFMQCAPLDCGGATELGIETDSGWVTWDSGIKKLSFTDRVKYIKHEKKINDEVVGDHCRYLSPVELIKYFDNAEYCGRAGLPMSTSGRKQLLVDNAKEYLMKAYNVDYRITPNDKEWISYMTAIFGEAKTNTYLEVMKKNKLIVECDRVDGDISSMYYDGQDEFCAFQENLYLSRIRVHYRIVSDEGKYLAEDLGYYYPAIILGFTYSNGQRITKVNADGTEWERNATKSWHDMYCVVGCDAGGNVKTSSCEIYNNKNSYTEEMGGPIVNMGYLGQYTLKGYVVEGYGDDRQMFYDWWWKKHTKIDLVRHVN